MLAPTTVPMWIGILAGITGNAQVYGCNSDWIGNFNATKHNLIRSNEVEADNLAIEIIKSSPFKTSAFSDFFGEMIMQLVMFRRSLSYLNSSNV